MANDKAKQAAYIREYNVKHKERLNARLKGWRAKNKERDREKVAAYQREYYARTREKHIARSREHGLRRRYGIGLIQYNQMLESQSGVCAICGQPPRPGKNLHIDHCHATGQVRGLLCDLCNRGIGHFADNPERMLNAISYLQKHRL